jgi:hypothetical protein
MLPSNSKSFLTDLEEEQKRDKKCGLGEALRSMDEPLRAEVMKALKGNSGYYSTTITSALKKRGFQVNQWQVRNCRKQCDCGSIPGESE